MSKPYIEFSIEQQKYVIWENLDNSVSRQQIYSHHNKMLIDSMLEEIKRRAEISLVYEDWHESSFNQ